jgi:hypothetical protein
MPDYSGRIEALRMSSITQILYFIFGKPDGEAMSF